MHVSCILTISELLFWVLENKVLRRVFGPKDEVTGDWTKLHEEELSDL